MSFMVFSTILAICVFHGLQHNTSLSYSVFEGLQHNTSLVHLNLNNTYIGLVATEDTAQALTTMLQQGTYTP